MALTANFVADFSSFMDATRDAVTALQGFKLTAEELGPGVDRGLEETRKHYEQIGRQARQLGTDVLAASKTFIDAFTEEQDAVQRLTTALEANGQATPAVTAAYAQMASQFQATTKYADESIIGVQAVLTTIGEVGPDQMQLALTAVTNLASGMKMDLNQAATLVAKAFASGGENLGKLKVLLGDSVQPGMDAAQMLQAINEKFGSAAQNDLQTYNGQVANLQNQMSDLQEQVGGILVETLTTLLGIFRALPDGVQTFTVAVIAIGGALAPVLVSLSSLVSLLSVTGLGTGIVSAFTAISAFLGPAGWIAIGVVALAGIIYNNWDAIAAATQKLYEGIKYWLVDKFTQLAAMVRAPIDAIRGAFQSLYNTVVGHSIVPDMIAGIGREFDRLDSSMVAPVRAATQAATRDFADLAQYSAQVNAILARSSLFTTGSQYERIGMIRPPGGASGGGGGAVTVNNTFNIVDTQDNIARRVSEEIMRTIRAGTQMGTA